MFWKGGTTGLQFENISEIWSYLTERTTVYNSNSFKIDNGCIVEKLVIQPVTYELQTRTWHESKYNL